MPSQTLENAAATRRLPAVHVVLRAAAEAGLVARYGHAEVVAALQDALGAARTCLRAGVTDAAPSPADVVEQATAALAARHRPVLGRAINATGIILHTGLGRAVMPDAARAAVAAMTGCCNLQIDLDDGQRLDRENIIRGLVTELTGAEDVLLVNNNAAATMLALRALAHGRETVVSRGELIEIGGSFRLPDIMAESGTTMREVGTTNKTHPRDYERAIGPDTALLLKVHKSNYDIVGFTREVSIAELAAVGHAKGVPVLDDLGCGAMVGLETFGLGHEMTLAESVAAGSDLVLSSTDKLIGGPQGGLIIGRHTLVERIRSHPLYRALRACKLTYAALEATLRLFKAPDQLVRTHPLYATLAKPTANIERQAHVLAAQLATAVPGWAVDVVTHQSYVGGGALPGQHLPSHAVRIRPAGMAPAVLARNLRSATLPVVARLHQDAVLLDMRTVAADEFDAIGAALRHAVATGPAPRVEAGA